MNINFENIMQKIVEWGGEHGLALISIIFLTWLSLHFVNQVITKIIRKTISKSSYPSESEERKREDTLIKISQNFFGIFIWIAGLLAILYELGMPIIPLITGAGILGVAIGFGAQSLIKDIINGLFIIAENQYRIGDYVCIGDYCGSVEDMTLRITKLRQSDGTIHYIPNGEIKVASNKSKDFSKVDFKIGVGYSTDINQLEKIINKVGDDLKADEIFGKHIIDAPHFLRIDDFLDYSISIHISGKVEPKQQYSITGEMRRRLKKMFDDEGIEIPYPTRVVRSE